MVRSLLKRPAAKETKGLSNRARWCRTCNQLKRDNPTHEVVKLTADQRALYDSEDANDTGAKVPRFNFGKYKGKTVEEVKETCPSYLFWVFQNRKDLFPKYKWLRSALLEANVFPAELLDREDDADDRAREVIDAIASAGAASSSPGAVPVEHVMPKAKPQGPWEGLSEKKRSPSWSGAARAHGARIEKSKSSGTGTDDAGRWHPDEQNWRRMSKSFLQSMGGQRPTSAGSARNIRGKAQGSGHQLAQLL